MVNYEQKPVRAFGTIALLLDIPAGTLLDDEDVSVNGKRKLTHILPASAMEY